MIIETILLHRILKYLLLLLIFQNQLNEYCNTVFANPPTSMNCTWKYVLQPISHFARGAASNTYRQRLCVYEGYWNPNQNLPVFLYTGNESPLEEYVNNTGLLWNLAYEFNALVIFAEHRYFGESIPELPEIDNCLAYLSSEEALADYASLISLIRNEWGAKNSAFIAFGGSYGGMLAAWLRMKYPHLIDGAISASAPIWGFPMDNCPLDSSAQVVTYAASENAGSSNNCVSNLKASYVFITDIGYTSEGRALLSNAMNLCYPLITLNDVKAFLSYLQSPLFDLAEGSYPFKSDYITYALLGSADPLPPWAMQVMCEYLSAEYGIRWDGEVKQVLFTVSIDNIQVHVDWDQTSNNGYSIKDVNESPNLLMLLSKVAQSIQVWYNVSGDMPSCIDWNDSSSNSRYGKQHSYSKRHRIVLPGESSSSIKSKPPLTITDNSYSDAQLKDDGAKLMKTQTCTMSVEDFKSDTAWNALVCNEGINLVPWWVQGVGNDLYWPPNQPTRNYSMEQLVQKSLDFCIYLESLGLYGIPVKRDEWSKWINTAYGGVNLKYASNIVFTNGNLDPWSPAGVDATTATTTTGISNHQSIISVTIDMGGHHLDLFWPNENDPDSVKQVRELEKDNVAKWINQVAVNYSS